MPAKKQLKKSPKVSPASLLNFDFYRKHRSASLLLLIVVLAGVFAAYRYYSIAADKHRFDLARQDLDKIYADIETKVGKPDKVEKDSSCSKAHLKNSRGPLVCHISSNFVYGVENLEKANFLVSKINETIDSNLENSSIKSQYTDQILTELKGIRDYKEYNQSFDMRKMTCGVSYIYASPPEPHLILSSQTKPQNLFVSVGCDSGAVQAHYQLSD